LRAWTGCPLPSQVRSQLTLILVSLLTRPRQESHP